MNDEDPKLPPPYIASLDENRLEAVRMRTRYHFGILAYLTVGAPLSYFFGRGTEYSWLLPALILASVAGLSALKIQATSKSKTTFLFDHAVAKLTISNLKKKREVPYCDLSLSTKKVLGSKVLVVDVPGFLDDVSVKIPYGHEENFGRFMERYEKLSRAGGGDDAKELPVGGASFGGAAVAIPTSLVGLSKSSKSE